MDDFSTSLKCSSCGGELLDLGLWVRETGDKDRSGQIRSLVKEQRDLMSDEIDGKIMDGRYGLKGRHKKCDSEDCPCKIPHFHLRESVDIPGDRADSAIVNRSEEESMIWLDPKTRNLVDWSIGGGPVKGDHIDHALVYRESGFTIRSDIDCDFALSLAGMRSLRCFCEVCGLWVSSHSFSFLNNLEICLEAKIIGLVGDEIPMAVLLDGRQLSISEEEVQTLKGMLESLTDIDSQKIVMANIIGDPVFVSDFRLADPSAEWGTLAFRKPREAKRLGLQALDLKNDEAIRAQALLLLRHATILIARNPLWVVDPVLTKLLCQLMRIRRQAFLNDEMRGDAMEADEENTRDPESMTIEKEKRRQEKQEINEKKAKTKKEKKQQERQGKGEEVSESEADEGVLALRTLSRQHGLTNQLIDGFLMDSEEWNHLDPIGQLERLTNSRLMNIRKPGDEKAGIDGDENEPTTQNQAPEVANQGEKVGLAASEPIRTAVNFEEIGRSREANQDPGTDSLGGEVLSSWNNTAANPLRE